MKHDRIEVGDYVDIDIAKDLPAIEGVILSVPCATGDSWIIKGRWTIKGRRWWLSDEEEVFYIQNFRYMVLRKKGEQNAETR